MNNSTNKQIYTPAKIEIIELKERDIITSSNMDPGGWVSEDSW